MLKQTLSAITALLITGTTLYAGNMSITENGRGAKGMRAEPVTYNQPYSQEPIEENNYPNYSQNQAYEPSRPEPVTYTAPQPVQATRSYNDTIIYAKAVKNSYFDHEAIKIALKLKRDAYIYFWAISYTGRGYLILPNGFDGGNKYKANMRYVVPHHSASYQFVSDRAGVENLYVLATNKPLNQKKLRNIFSQKAGGVIPMASKAKINSFVQKDILIMAKEEQLKYDIKHFTIKVRARGNSVVQQPSRPATPATQNIYIINR